MRATIGLDTATPYTAVAAVRGAEVVHDEQVPPAGERPAHAQALLPALERAAAAAGGWAAVGRLLVGVGPGSFTGLRIGIASAKALAQAGGCGVGGVLTCGALARGIDAPLRLAVIDARRNEAFAALYRDDGSEVWPPFVAAPADLAERVSRLDGRPLAAGDGALRFRAELTQAGAQVPEAAHAAHRVSAVDVCAVAAGGGFGGEVAVEPVYLREPDAKRWRERRQGTQ